MLLLQKFSNIEIQYFNKDDMLITKNIPIHYKFQEKEFILDKSDLQIYTGNVNVLPRAVLEFTGLSPNTDRQTSKFNKINRMKAELVKENTGYESYNEFQWNCVSYDFSYTLSIMCRGMNEVCQIIEEIAPKFNPVMYLDVYDAEDESEPTRVPLQLGDISFSNDGYSETSTNTYQVSFDLTLSGYLFQPVNMYSRIKDFYINVNNSGKDCVKIHFDVKNKLPQLWPDKTYVDYSKAEIELLKLVKNGDEVTLIYNSNVDVGIKFFGENCDVEKVSKDTCKITNKGENAVITAEVTFGGLYQRISLVI